MIPKKLQLDYVLAAVMMYFPGYDLQKLLHTPYTVVLQLFCLSEKAKAIRKTEILDGSSGLHSQKRAQQLLEVEDTMLTTDKTKLSEVVTEDNKRRAAEEVLRVLKARGEINK